MNNKEIFEKAIGRPAMMGFVILCGVYLTTGQLIPRIRIMTKEKTAGLTILISIFAIVGDLGSVMV